MKYLLIFFSFLLAFTSAAQSTMVDSLETELNNAQHDSTRLKIMLDLIPLVRMDLPKNLSYCTQAVELSRKLESQQQELAALNWLAGFYAQQNQLDKAAEIILECLDVQVALGDSLNWAISTGNLGTLMVREKRYDQALGYFNGAYNYFRAKQDTLGIADHFKVMAFYHEELGNFDSAVVYHKWSAHWFEMARRPNARAQALIDVGYSYNYLNMPDSGLVYMRQAEALYKNVLGYEHPKLLSGMGRIYTKLGQYDSARHWANHGLEVMLAADYDLGVKINAQILYELDSIEGNWESALKHLKLAQAFSDSARNEETAFKVEYMVAERELSEKAAALVESELQADIESEKAAKNKLYWIMTSIAGVLVLILSLLFISRQRLRLRTKTAEANLKSEQLNRAEDEKKHLQSAIQLKDRELTTFALANAEKIEMLERIKTKLEDKANENSLAELKVLVKDQVMGANEWSEFKTRFESVHPDFTKRLLETGPELTANDIKICILLRLNMSSKQIASLVGISPKSVDQSRYRIRKKLDLESTKNLQDYLLTV